MTRLPLVYILCLALALPLAYGSLKAQSTVWVKSLGGTADDVGGDIVVDASGNIYVTGSFTGTVDFDPGFGISNLTSVGGIDFFIQKLDNSGDLIWVKSVGGPRDDQSYSIAVDLNGDVFTTGYFQDTVDFDPGTGSTILTTDGYPPTQQGYQDIFILKLDASGNFLWAIGMGDNYTAETGRSIAVDQSGNVYTAGQFYSPFDFDPGPGIDDLNLIGSKQTTFLQKLDGSGNFLWAASVYGEGFSIEVDQYENVYSTGYFSDTIDFDPGPDTFNLTTSYWTDKDVFIQKLNASGNLVWAKSISGIGSYQYGYSIAVDLDGNVLTTGVFEDTADFDPDTSVFNLVSGGFGDAFIQKLDSNGSFVWAKSMGGVEHARGHSIDVDGSGNVYTIGDFWVTGDFDPGVGSFILNSEGGSDVFIQKLDPSGNFLWAQSMGGNSDDLAKSIAVNAVGESYTIGQYAETAYFYLGSGPISLVSAGQYDIFIQKLGTILSINETEAAMGFKVFPNPSNGQFTIELNSTSQEQIELKIVNILGQEVFAESVKLVPGIYRKEIDIQAHTSGIYLLQLMTNQGVKSVKMVLE